MCIIIFHGYQKSQKPIELATIKQQNTEIKRQNCKKNNQTKNKKKYN